MTTHPIDEIFAAAKVPKLGNEQLWNQCAEIMSSTMARLSVTEGLSLRRVDRYEKQKQTLIADLVEMREAGKVAL